MYFLNDKGAARLAELKVGAGVELTLQAGKQIIDRGGNLVRKFKLTNHGKVHHVELAMDEYSLVHPAEVQPIVLDEEEPLVFEKMNNCARGARYKVELCRDGGRAFVKVKTLSGVNPSDFSFAINHIIQDLLTSASQNLRMKITSFPQIQ